jgi:hypothetical protein
MIKISFLNLLFINSRAEKNGFGNKEVNTQEGWPTATRENNSE